MGPLYRVSETKCNELADMSETGMGFQIVDIMSGNPRTYRNVGDETAYDSGQYAILNGGVASQIDLNEEHTQIEEFDVQALGKIPELISPQFLDVFPSRLKAKHGLSALLLPPYRGIPGAIPLIGTISLTTNTMFYRLLSAPKDFRYVNGNLTAGTYLTTQLDLAYLNTGFAAVGRLALPIPLPAVNVLQYELIAPVTLQVGTVTPLFGQAGGGVEVRTITNQSATFIGSHTIPYY